MANNLVAKPWFVDTTGVLSTDPAIKLRAISWVNDQASGKDIAAADDLLLSNAAGARVIGKRAIVAGDGFDMLHFPADFNVNGLTVTALDGGVLYLFVD